MNPKSRQNLSSNCLENILMNGAEEIHYINGSWISKAGKLKKLTKLGYVSISFQDTDYFSPMDVAIDNLNLGDDIEGLPIDAYYLTIDEDKGVLYARFHLFKKYNSND